MKRNLFFTAVFVLSGFVCMAQESSFSEGERLFRQNKSEQAIPYLLKAVQEGGFPKAYNYLALCYFQQGDLDGALDICTKGMDTLGTDKKVLAFNGGNIAFAKGDFAAAESWYSKAIVASASYAQPYLNRANARLKLSKFDECKADYQKYLELVPNDSQRPQIERLLAMLEAEKERLAKEEAERALEEARIKEEEERLAQQRRLEEEARREEEARLLEQRRKEEEARRAEEERLAQKKREEEEARRAEEAEKRRKLLEDVAASLRQTESENMLAGSEGTIDYDYETELE